MTDAVQLRFRSPLNSPEFRGARPRAYSRTVENGMIIERDVEVPTRFGYVIYCDIFRPADEKPAPPLIAWTPYGKHDPSPLAKIYPDSGVLAEWMSDYTIFEAPDPLYWTARGYAVITADIPGAWYASTQARYCDRQEAEAYYDLIEWAGVQPWSSGKVGLSGVSYLTVMQWRVAELNPPHLAAINPWEGWTDTYRELTYHGGIPETFFWPYIQVRWGASDHPVEDLWRETREHPFFDAFWESKAARLDRIKVPAFIIASWSDHGLHTRGTLEGFKKISSERKWLEVHGRKKWHWYYEPDAVERQRLFFDHVLKGEDNEFARWPTARVEVRDGSGSGTFKQATAWPIENTRYKRLYLDAAQRALCDQAPAEPASLSYESLADEPQAVFDHRFTSATELVGHMKLKLHVSAAESDDLDLFVAIQKVAANGEVVGFTHFAIFEGGPVAMGWLRVSHRELDPAASTEFQPVLKHQRLQKVAPGEIVEVDIEILASGTRFEAGESLRLVVKGRDIYKYPKPLLYAHHEDTVNLGLHTIHTGGNFPSYLLIPEVDLP